MDNHLQLRREGRVCGAFPGAGERQETCFFGPVASHGTPGPLMCSQGVMTVFSGMGWVLNSLLWCCESRLWGLLLNLWD